MSAKWLFPGAQGCMAGWGDILNPLRRDHVSSRDRVRGCFVISTDEGKKTTTLSIEYRDRTTVKGVARSMETMGS